MRFGVALPQSDMYSLNTNNTCIHSHVRVQRRCKGTNMQDIKPDRHNITAGLTQRPPAVRWSHEAADGTSRCLAVQISWSFWGEKSAEQLNILGFLFFFFADSLRYNVLRENMTHSFWLSPAWLLGWKSLTMIPNCRIFSINFSRCSSRLSNFSAILLNCYWATKNKTEMTPFRGALLSNNRCLLLAADSTTATMPNSFTATKQPIAVSNVLLPR